MSSQTQGDDILTTHNYDGIQEYDNPMPGWWTFIFISNIVWAVVYVVGISMDFLPQYEDDLRAEMKVQAEIEARMLAKLPPVTPQVLEQAFANPDAVMKGSEVFATNCAQCHGRVGEGLIGPNLTDDAWLNGDASLSSLHDVIAKGTNKGMPGWGPILLQEDLIAVTAFAKSLQGTNPPNAKAPEGEPASASAPGKPSDG